MDWAETVKEVEDLGLFPRNGGSVSQMLSRVLGQPKQEPKKLFFFEFYFSGSPSEARATANNLMLILRRILRESSLSAR
jgi:hypothetical protein